MIEPEIKRLLRQWGRWFGPRAAEDGEAPIGPSAPATNVLARHGRPPERRKDMPKPPAKYRSFVDADGRLRKERAPKNFSHGTASASGAKPMFIPPAADAVELVVLELYRKNALMALVLRAEYCLGACDRNEKTTWLGYVVGDGISVRRFRHELELAHTWLSGRLAGRNLRAA